MSVGLEKLFLSWCEMSYSSRKQLHDYRSLYVYTDLYRTCMSRTPKRPGIVVIQWLLERDPAEHRVTS